MQVLGGWCSVLGGRSMGQLKSFRDLKVYQKLKALHIEVPHETPGVPEFEIS